MVHHCLICANSKLEENVKFDEIVAGGRQIDHVFAWLQRICVLPSKRAVTFLREEGQLQGIYSPQNTAANRISSPTAASARKYFWQCGTTRGKKRGHQQAVEVYRTLQRPESTHRALQKVMSVTPRRHWKDITE